MNKNSTEERELNYELIEFNVREATEELNRVIYLCEKKELDEGEALVSFQHALGHLFFAYNGRFLTNKKWRSLTYDEWYEIDTTPPDIF